VKTLQEQLAEMDAGQAEATKLRQEEKEAYGKASADYKQSADAIANATADALSDTSPNLPCGCRSRSRSCTA